MSATLAKALIVLAAACILLFWSLGLFLKNKVTISFVQLLGAGFLIIVAIVHIFEALRVFMFMQWGSPHSIGHYLDFSSAILGVTLFLVGLFFQLFKKAK